MVAEMFGRSTLTAAGVPSGSSAKCTCATEALATGSTLERFEHLADGLAVDAGEGRDHLLGRKRRHAILQLGEFLGDVGGQKVAPGRKHLAELDEDGSEILQREPQAHRARRRRIAPEGERARGRPQPAEPLVAEQELVEPVLERDQPDFASRNQRMVRDCKVCL